MRAAMADMEVEPQLHPYEDESLDGGAANRIAEAKKSTFMLVAFRHDNSRLILMSGRPTVCLWRIHSDN